MRTDQLPKEAGQSIDDPIRPMIKRTLGLPPNAANEYLFGAREDSLFGIPLAAEDSDIAIIDGSVKLLTSKDPVIYDMAWAELRDDADYRFQFTRVQNSEDFLNSVKIPGEKTRNRYASRWTHARKASDHLKIRWHIDEENNIEIEHGEVTISKRNRIFHDVRNSFRKMRTISLRNHPHQDKTNACLAVAKESSQIFTEGAFTRFKDRDLATCFRSLYDP